MEREWDRETQKGCRGQISNGQCLQDRQKRRALGDYPSMSKHACICIRISICTGKDTSSLFSALPTHVRTPTLRPHERDTVLESTNAVGKQVNIAVLHESLKQSSGAPDAGCRQEPIMNVISSWGTYFPESRRSIYLIRQCECLFLPLNISL